MTESEPTVEVPLLLAEIHFHDSHFGDCPKCHHRNVWTDSPKMVEEAKTYLAAVEVELTQAVAAEEALGTPEAQATAWRARARCEGAKAMQMRVLSPVTGHIAGRMAQIFPVNCEACKTLFISYPAQDNAEEIARLVKEYKPYYPHLFEGPNAAWGNRLIPKFSDHSFTVDEFVAQVRSEKNTFSREAIVRRFEARRIYLPF